MNSEKSSIEIEALLLLCGLSLLALVELGAGSFTTGSQSNRPLIFAILGGALLIAIGLAVGLGIGLRDDQDDNNNNINTQQQGNNNDDVPTTSPTAPTPAYKSATGFFTYAAVVADSKLASEIGTDIMARKRGNAVDAAVASLFATGLLSAHSCGLGGGSFIVIYDNERNEWHAIDARESAPGAATEDMYVGQRGKSRSGGMASGVPGEVMGLWEIHRRLGKLPWSDVVSPSIKLCQAGVPLTQAMYTGVSLGLTKDKHKQDFAPYFDENGQVKPVGSLIQLPKLARTLQAISDDPTSFYNGSLAKEIVADLQEEGGIITEDDLRDYKLKWTKPTMLHLPGGYRLHSIPAPGSGPVLSYILNILTGYNMKPSDVETSEGEILSYHRIIEAFKFAFGKRTELGDEDFVDISQMVKNMVTLSFGEETRALINDSQTQPTSYYNPRAAITNDAGTSHLSVIDSQGSAVAVTSTINSYFGSKVKGYRTGIVFNNEMNDFSVPSETNIFGLPASKANYIRPGKRPMSSMCPTIIWDENRKRVKLVTGAAGGRMITTTIAKNIIDVLWLNRSLLESVDSKRAHHQLTPNYVFLEKGFSKDIEEGLEAKGHEIRQMRGMPVIQAIDILDNGEIAGTADFRKGGEPMGF
ncbi:gamma-glutamyltranspeptidase 1 [Plakobranchus ocellatus]|uniref:Gamma-glutamyltranspeptidase 1 n=1 Tax=Plakobranchus ocellatus TaxID=259542 RepID=A0AAV3YJK1_9GAST|nr:gamma-glutamyltranspeptidase 1 [Plakobranchus ocellatus]